MKLKLFWHRFRQSGYGPVGLVLLGLIVLVAVFAPQLAPHDPQTLTDEMLAGPGAGHWMGTDHLGRDVLSGVIWGTRVSLLVGITAALISMVIGSLIGAISGYAGGALDEGISKLIDIFLMIPTFFLILLIIVMYGNSLLYIMLVIGLTTWPANARLMRAQALSLRERTFTKAAVALGEGHPMILARHVIPNGMYPIIANTTLQMAGAILTEAGLSFLGLGDPNTPSWGKMIFEGRSFIQTAWWVSFFPGAAIVCTVMAFYFIGDGLNLALNPKLQERGA